MSGRDVLGQLVYLAEATQWSLARDALRYGPSPDRLVDRSARSLGDEPVSEPTGRLRATALGRFHVLGTPSVVVSAKSSSIVYVAPRSICCSWSPIAVRSSTRSPARGSTRSRSAPRAGAGCHRMIPVLATHRMQCAVEGMASSRAAGIGSRQATQVP
jgi:hypothetical protein